MHRDYSAPSDRFRKLRPEGPPARLLLAEPDRAIAALLRHTFLWHGLGEPQIVEEAEEALDTLGALAQSVDLVLMAVGPNGRIETRILDVLRRIRSPVRIAAYGPLTSDAIVNAAPLIGIAAYIDMAGRYGMPRHARDLLAAPCTVQTIMNTARVPLTIDPCWADAIYGARPGETFALARIDITTRTTI